MEERPAGFQNKALADLARLRGRLPPGETPEPASSGSASDGAPAAASPFGPKLVVRRERKQRKGKTVTCITGIAGAARLDLAKQLARALGCGGTVQGDDLVLQGDHVARAATWLRERGAPRVVEGN